MLLNLSQKINSICHVLKRVRSKATVRTVGPPIPYEFLARRSEKPASLPKRCANSLLDVAGNSRDLLRRNNGLQATELV